MRALQAPGFTLEPQTTAHAEAMFTLLGEPALYEFENEPPPSLDWLRARFAMLESRSSPDGREQWLNWVLRLPDSNLAGYVQATVGANRHASIAYVLATRYWGLGIARRAVEAMIPELVERYSVRHLSAVLKQGNLRSLRLLERMGFTPASADEHTRREIAADELLMLRGA